MATTKKIQSQSEKVNQQFAFDGPTMRVKTSRGYKDHFGNAVSQFEHILKTEKSEIAKRKPAITMAEQIAEAKLIAAEDSKRIAKQKLKNSDEARMAKRNSMNITKEAVERENAKLGFKYVTNEKGRAERVEL